MSAAEPMETEGGDFFGQPENTVQSDLDVPEPMADIDAIDPATVRQPKTRFTFERGYRKESGHPKFPWHRLVKQRADHLITAELARWSECDELPTLSTKRMKSMPFAFPWDIKEIKDELEHPEKLQEWNDMICMSNVVPMLIYTPTLFALLMSAPSGRQPTDANWLPPVLLSTTVLRKYMQIMHFLSINKSLLTVFRRRDVLASGGRMFAKRIDMLSNVVLQNRQFVELARCESIEQALEPRFEQVFYELAELFASHTYTYIKAVEVTILRLCNLDPDETKPLESLLLESAVPDPQAERINPFSERLLGDWRKHNAGYVNRLYQLRKQPLPVASEERLHSDNVRSVNKEAVWLLAKRLVDEVPV